MHLHIQSTLPKLNLHKLHNHLHVSHRSFLVLFSLFSIVFTPHKVRVYCTNKLKVAYQNVLTKDPKTIYLSAISPPRPILMPYTVETQYNKVLGTGIFCLLYQVFLYQQSINNTNFFGGVILKKVMLH